MGGASSTDGSDSDSAKVLVISSGEWPGGLGRGVLMHYLLKEADEGGQIEIRERAYDEKSEEEGAGGLRGIRKRWVTDRLQGVNANLVIGNNEYLGDSFTAADLTWADKILCPSKQILAGVKSSARKSGQDIGDKGSLYFAHDLSPLELWQDAVEKQILAIDGKLYELMKYNKNDGGSGNIIQFGSKDKPLEICKEILLVGFFLGMKNGDKEVKQMFFHCSRDDWGEGETGNKWLPELQAAGYGSNFNPTEDRNEAFSTLVTDSTGRTDKLFNVLASHCYSDFGKSFDTELVQWGVMARAAKQWVTRLGD